MDQAIGILGQAVLVLVGLVLLVMLVFVLLLVVRAIRRLVYELSTPAALVLAAGFGSRRVPGRGPIEPVERGLWALLSGGGAGAGRRLIGLYLA
jgi:hypothetical protein